MAASLAEEPYSSGQRQTWHNSLTVLRSEVRSKVSSLLRNPLTILRCELQVIDLQQWRWSSPMCQGSKCSWLCWSLSSEKEPLQSSPVFLIDAQSDSFKKWLFMSVVIQMFCSLCSRQLHLVLCRKSFRIFRVWLLLSCCFLCNQTLKQTRVYTVKWWHVPTLLTDVKLSHSVLQLMA